VPEYNAAQGAGMILDCNIQLTLLSQQSFKVELEGTNTGGYLGGALNLIYQHKNLFRGAELFNLKLKGAYEAFKQQDKIAISQEYGAETSLRFPKFLSPFLKKEDFIKKYNPTTTLLAGFDYQEIPLFTRTMAYATFGYNWNAGNYITHIVNPSQLYFVSLPPNKIDSAFNAKINTTPYLAASYRDVMILGGNYSFVFNDQKINRSKHWFLRVNAEAAGNMLALISKLAKIPKTDDSYNIFDQPFAQYVRADVDLRYNYILNDVSSIVLRGFVGAGIPFGNSSAIPFEKQYFEGGANGIRAWQVRSLGPGRYKSPDTDSQNIPYQTADIKIEANAEYRFNLFWILEGALFLDAGNIWTFNEDDSRPGSQFTKTFLNDIAVGSGLGFRLDLDFVLLRADIGMKLRDPGLSNGSKWIIEDWSGYYDPKFTFVVAIGYPF